MNKGLSFFDPDLRLNACSYAFYFDCLCIGTFDGKYETDCLTACNMILNSLNTGQQTRLIIYTDPHSVSMIWNAIKACGCTEESLFASASDAVNDLRSCPISYWEILRDFYLAISMNRSGS